MGDEAMQRRTLAQLCWLATAGSVAAALTCGCLVRELYLQSAVDYVAAQLEPSGGAVAKRLEALGNPRGEGVLIVVKAAEPCRVEYSWASLGKFATYAVNSASLALTPGLQPLSNAPIENLTKFGFDAAHASQHIHAQVCGPSTP
jgi:hypothetical protein